MRIVSLIPSWTETLIEANANVVGRTRFCIHPAGNVARIPSVGGTKSFDVEKIRALRPDLILLDREENTREMADVAMTIAPVHITHVESVHDLPAELASLADLFHEPTEQQVKQTLLTYRTRYVSALSRPAPVLHKTSFIYCIWKDPWMAVGQKTFIASMLEQTGYDLDFLLPKTGQKYPVFEIDKLSDNTLVLLSSEPYPFGKDLEVLRLELAPREVRLIDGESYSWFGIRALRFLEALKPKNS